MTDEKTQESLAEGTKKEVPKVGETPVEGFIRRFEEQRKKHESEGRGKTEAEKLALEKAFSDLEVLISTTTTENQRALESATKLAVEILNRVGIVSGQKEILAPLQNATLELDKRLRQAGKLAASKLEGLRLKTNSEVSPSKPTEAAPVKPVEAAEKEAPVITAFKELHKSSPIETLQGLLQALAATAEDQNPNDKAMREFVENAMIAREQELSSWFENKYNGKSDEELRKILTDLQKELSKLQAKKVRFQEADPKGVEARVAYRKKLCEIGAINSLLKKEVIPPQKEKTAPVAKARPEVSAAKPAEAPPAKPAETAPVPVTPAVVEATVPPVAEASAPVEAPKKVEWKKLMLEKGRDEKAIGSVNDQLRGMKAGEVIEFGTQSEGNSLRVEKLAGGQFKLFGIEGGQERVLKNQTDHLFFNKERDGSFFELTWPNGEYRNIRELCASESKAEAAPAPTAPVVEAAAPVAEASAPVEAPQQAEEPKKDAIDRRFELAVTSIKKELGGLQDRHLKKILKETRKKVKELEAAGKTGRVLEEGKAGIEAINQILAERKAAAEQARPVEQPTETRTEKEKPPEQIAQEQAFAYWSKRLEDDKSRMKNPNIQVQGGDFDIARCQVYLAKIQEGNFFEEVQISGTYDGKPRETTEPSVYNFFKGIADQKAVKQYAESFKSAPDLIEERKKQAEEAQKIVDTIEKIKPTEQAKVDKQTEETGETFLGEAGKIARDFFEEALKGAKTAVDREKYQAYLDKLKVGDVISSIKLSGDGGAKIEGSSIFEFFRDLVNPENVEIQKTILNGSAGEQYKKEVAQAQLFLAALEKQALESAAAA